ncbi:hypothetical protein NOV72_06110 [Caballeronia novacaledonica]|uniref:cGAS/DncV-like nucleotidyltransferase C-terminal helical domain-containing protein n=1 Tax=Caballeronia novacaledonica TaxID=1544861 RepID=A0A2U3IFK0_9BURK|nr:hypothetical protein [Caballeronia novacaledonica]SPB18905.1 hypothetical protein NOV72_06110 [Caballeronia novacaledonica]
MSTKYSDKLQKLRNRRTPTVKSLTFDSVPRPVMESFETKGKGDATRYALGCMAEVPAEYTKISLRDGQRVADQLTSQKLYSVETRLQGSVPLNVHIYSSSDVDLLVLAAWFCQVDQPAVQPNSYNFSTGPKSTLKELVDLRAFCETYLAQKYPAAEVDTSGAKAIAVSGGSLARKVDIVPSHWIDTVDYQRLHLEYFRDVAILDKHTHTTLRNSPFRHMMLINAKDKASDESAKKAIRLLKCLCRDADADIGLSSYEIAGLIYHMPDEKLKVNPFFPLVLLGRVDEYLRQLENNPSYAKSLRAPDGSRLILDTTQKINALTALRVELTDTINNVAADYDAGQQYQFDRALALERARRTLDSTIIY